MSHRLRATLLAFLVCRAGAVAAQPSDYVADPAASLDRWAVIVGISEYDDPGITDLRYAHRDAVEFYKLIQTPMGGSFREDHVQLLTSPPTRADDSPTGRIRSEPPTTANITKALRGFLKKAGPQDHVVLFFSCHGAPDPDRPKLVFLLSQDTDPNDIAATAVPMREIEQSLRYIVQARTTVIIADTCHSGAVATQGTKDVTLNLRSHAKTLLDEIAGSRPGTSCLLSAMADGKSFEDVKWGGGHGVFTHFLLEGMKGQADRPPHDGVIRFGELFDFVWEKVKDATQQNATQQAQEPVISPGSDREFPLAVTSEEAANVRLDIGRRLYQLGLDLDEPRLLQSAARHLEQAQDLYARRSRVEKQVESLMLQGQSLLAVAEYQQAATVFAHAEQLGDADAGAEASLYLGIAEAKSGDADKSVQALNRFVSSEPASSKVSWARRLLSWLQRTPVVKRAILIGIDRPGEEIHKSDVAMMKTALLSRCGLRESEIDVRIERTSSRDLVAVLENAKKAKKDDVTLV